MDMLVPLYNLDGVSERIDRVGKRGITVRLAMAYERDVIIGWVRRSFDKDGSCWAGECEAALSRVPASCHIATRDGELLGFACFDATARGMFGPTGTDEKARGLGVGAALLVASLAAMREAGYAYAVIGGVGEHVSGFYQKVVAAVEIADSEPGIYRDRISPDHK
jgi:GNAT superfamily N-acetyltransferase